MQTWNQLKIKDLGRVVTGKTPPTDNAEYFDGDELFVSPKDLSRDSYYVHSTETRISEKALDKFRGQVIPRDTVMFTSLSFAFGKMGIASKTCITNQQINSIVVGSNHHPRFVYYLLRVYEPFIFAYNSGIDTPIVPKSVFEKIPVVVPHKSTQEKVAAVLSAYDDLIANNQRRIALLESMAEEIYREWFVRMRFPGVSDDELNAGRPKSWPVRKLGELLELCYGKALPDQNRVPGEIPVYGSGGIVGYHNTALVSTPGIIVGRKGNVGSVFFAERPFFPIDTVYYVKSTLPNELLVFLLQRMNFINNDSAVPGLNREQAYSNEVLLPETGLIEQFAKTVQPMFKQAAVLRQQVESLCKTRDALLPRLISGKLCVDQLDIQFPPSMRAETAEAAP